MRNRLNVMVFVVLMLAASHLLLLGVGSARGATSYGSITGTIFYDVPECNPINRGDVVILEANRGLEVARVPVVDSTFGPIQVPVGSYRIVFDSLVAAIKGNPPPVFFPNANPSCFGDATPVTVMPNETTPVDNWTVALVPGLPQPPIVKVLSVAGQVVDSQENSVPGIKIIIRDSCAGIYDLTGESFYTGEDGTFQYLAPGAGLFMQVRLRFYDATGTYRSGYYADADGVKKVVDNFLDGTIIDFTLGWGKDIGVIHLQWGALDLSPAQLSFGDVALPGSTVQMVTASNVSQNNLTITGISFQDGSSPDFAIYAATSPPISLTPDSHEELPITYTPHTLGPATATLVVTVTASDAQEHQLTATLTGAGVPSEAPPAEQVAATVDFIQAAVEQGTLTGTGPPQANNAQVTALLNQIKAAGDMAARGNSKAACQQLLNALQRVDGDPQPPDIVEGPAAAELMLLIQLTRQQLGCN